MSIRNRVEFIYYYGTGCSSSDRKLMVKEVLESVFTNARIKVEHDLDGAVYATAGSGLSSVNILGTGSNSCLCDGYKIIDQRGGQGYILGDEAGGAWFGIRIVTDWLDGIMEGALKQHLDVQAGFDRNHILQHVYKQPNANVFLSSFAPLLITFKEDSYVQNLMRYGFEYFITRYLLKYPDHTNYPAHFIGSLAYYHRDILESSLSLYGIKSGNILRKPMDGLIQYHLQQLNKG